MVVNQSSNCVYLSAHLQLLWNIVNHCWRIQVLKCSSVIANKLLTRFDNLIGYKRSSFIREGYQKGLQTAECYRQTY
ncbi:hypothetical protein BJ165DRAFT_1507183 [Panaeolus papilionaceus]|nr:hypothetical protein BJ165DRAFT_1507183 [Panaeolus papilionaceus]